MLTEILSLGLSFLFAWHGRDRIWTPTFTGTREARFVQALGYYNEAMGLAPPNAILIEPFRRVVADKPTCAWAWKTNFGVTVGFSTHEKCTGVKPEILAMHEQCHRRMAHTEAEFWNLPVEQKEREVQACMVAYSVKERRLVAPPVGGPRT